MKPHCEHNGELKYYTTLDDKLVTDDKVLLTGYCLLQADNCPYYVLFKKNDYCRIQKYEVGK